MIFGFTGFQYHIPETLDDGERQLTTLQANITRCITMNRWVVEAVNGRFSRDFKIFRADFINKRCPHIMQEFSIAAAFLNHFAKQFIERSNVHSVLDAIQEKLFEDNRLGQIVEDNNLNMRHRMFRSISSSNLVFPELSIEDLQLIALGTYQIRQAKSYVGEHLRSHGMYTIEVCREEPNTSILSAFGGIDPYVLRARIKSRHVGNKSYFTYIVVDRGIQQGYRGILGYYCYCAAGKRTVGCCSHTMSILWYMGYGSRQGHFEAPASFLDDLLIL